MSFLNKIFQSIPVKIPDRSGFDLSHEVLTSAACGTVIPITHFEVLPGDTISMGSMMRVTLPPFAVPFMGRIDAELTAAFIPNRLLWAGWHSFITQNDGTNISGHSGPNARSIPYNVPVMEDDFPNSRQTLADYLGCPDTANSPSPNALPFLAYHKFCDDWIRDDNLMKPFFSKVPYTQGALPSYNAYLVHYLNSFFNLNNPNSWTGLSYGSFASLYPEEINPSFLAECPFDVTIGLGDLRQRCWAKDYFTTATTRPQAGAASSVVFDTSGNTGSITIASLRAANSLQKWMERNNIAGTDYGDQILSHFGVRPPDSVLNRSVLLGSVRTPVYVGSVENNSGANSQGAGGTASSSPYGSILGSAAGFGSATDKGSLVDNFTAKEHGYIMVFFTLIPHAYYDSGIIRSMLHSTIGDYAWPEFAGIGDQPIYSGELSSSDDNQQIFGYNQRYSEYKFLPDRVSGYLATGQPLSAFALKRNFGGAIAELGSDFLEIPKDYLSQVFAYWENGDTPTTSGVSTGDGGFSCIINAYFDCKALRVLPEYSLPHL